MSLEDLKKFLSFSKHEKTDLVLTIILPLISGVLIILAFKPSWITSSNTFNLCLLSFIVIMPVWGLNVLIWSIITWKLLHGILKHAASWIDNMPDESQARLMEFLNDLTMPSSFYGTNTGRQGASIVTLVSSYIIALIVYFKLCPQIAVGI